MSARPFRSVLVANRGEIVVRICRTLEARAMRSIAVWVTDDEGAAHVRAADDAVEVCSYLDAGALVAAALASGAEAVHPGYGFLSEDAGFARAVIEAGLVWIGPPPEAIAAMGDKIRAKERVAAAGVPVVPGAGAAGMTDADLAEAAMAVGLPVLLKPAAGGGGKGMRRVSEPGQLLPAIAAARREAASAFADDTLLVERWVTRPRHVEVQVFADGFGSVVHLGERECSLQRRHQKIVEESPSPLLDDATRAAMAQSAIAAARACGYVGAGTVEFIVPGGQRCDQRGDQRGDQAGEYFFMEMNTRLQVEHPVTEAVTGVDLVDWQLRVAAGEPLPRDASEVRCSGHALEARIYAEDPERGYLPATGTVVALRLPTARPHVRVDAALCVGLRVGSRYDPMLGKVIAWGSTRADALERLRGALADTAVLGVTTNVGHLERLLASPDVVAGELHTELVEDTLEALAAPGAADTEEALAVAGCFLLARLAPAGPVVDPWDVPDGWRVGGRRSPTTFALRAGGHRHQVDLEARSAACGRRATVGASVTVAVAVAVDGRALGHLHADVAGNDVVVTAEGRTRRWMAAVVEAGPSSAAGPSSEVWVTHRGSAWRFGVDAGSRVKGGPGGGGGAGPVRSPMPGMIVAVHVAPGQEVTAGQPLLAVEAMKMEHTVVAPVAGKVASLWASCGQTVALDEPLAEIEPA